ncbi:MAG: glycosyltransferase family 4 protein, partial [Thiotrichaceae bacterium]
MGYHLLISAIEFLTRSRSKSKTSSPKKIIATATFYSDHWIKTHLQPLAQSSQCEELLMVASTPVPELDKVTALYPPPWLKIILGSVGSRLAYFSYIVLKERPDVLVGFHLLLNGLLVLLLGKITGAKSVYICGGGRVEVEGGGYNTENRIFNKIGQPDFFIERQLLKAVNKIDLVVTMGSGAIDFFKEKGVDSQFEIMPGGFDESLFIPTETKPEFDLILVGRLSQVKRVDRFLRALKLSTSKATVLTAVIVGCGPLRAELEQLTAELGLTEQVSFVGWKNDIEQWLQKSRVFVLTSDSEGLSQAMIQAMMCGLPVIVSDVGDLKDLVQDGYNGYLVPTLTPESFSAAFDQIFENDKSILMGKHALDDVRKLSIDQVALQWDRVL